MLCPGDMKFPNWLFSSPLKIKHLSGRCPTCFAFHFCLYTTKTKNSTMNAKPNLTPEKTCPRDKS